MRAIFSTQKVQITMSETTSSSESSTSSEEDVHAEIDEKIDKSMDALRGFDYPAAEKAIAEAYELAEQHAEELPRVLSKYFAIFYITHRRDVKALQEFIATVKKRDDGKEVLEQTEKEVVAEMDGLYRKYRSQLTVPFYVAVNPFPGLVEKVRETKGLDLKVLVRYLDIAKACKSDIKSGLVSDLSAAAFHNFAEYYSTLDAKSLRSIDEKMLRKFNDLLQDCLKGSEYKQFMKLEVEMALDFVCSEYLGKQYDGLLTLSKITLSKELIEIIRKKEIMPKLLGDLHRDLVPPFARVMGKMFLGGYYDREMMEEFWKVCLAQPVAVQDAFFAVWPQIIACIPSKCVDDFWNMVRVTESFPEGARKLLQKLAPKCKDTKSIVDVLWKASIGENREAYVQVITSYVPSDFEKYCEIKDKAFDLIKSKTDTLFAVMLLTNIWKDTSTASTKSELDLLLSHYEGFDAIGFVSLFKLIKKIAKAFTQPLDDSEIRKLETISEAAITVDSKIVNSLFKDLTKMNKGKLLRVGQMQELLRWISEMKSVDTGFFDLFSFLFNELNKTVVGKDQISYGQLKGMDELWTLVRESTIPEAAEFLVALVSKSDTLEVSVREFVERCMKTIEKKGYLLALSILIRKIEGSIDLSSFGIHRNGFLDSSSLIKVHLTKDYIGTLKIPASITTEEFMARVETLTNVKRTKLTVTIKDKILSSTHNFKEDETFKVLIAKDATPPVKVFTKKCSLPSQIVKHSASFAKMKEFLVSDEDQLAELCLELLNYIETFDDEMATFRSLSDEMPWDDLFDMKHRFMLLYRLNLVANIIHENDKNYLERFFRTGGYRKLVNLLFSVEGGYFKKHEHANLLISIIVTLDKVSNTPAMRPLKSQDLQTIGIDKSVDSLLGWISATLASNPTTAGILISVLCDFLKEIEHVSWEQEKFSNFYDLTMFCQVRRIRARTVKLFATMDHSESLALFLKKINKATEGNCLEFFNYLSKLLEKCDDLLPAWRVLVDQLDSHLLIENSDTVLPDDYAEDVKHFASMLRAKMAHPDFISGIVSTLYEIVPRIPADVDIDEERVVNILLFKISFNLSRYVPTPERLFLLAIRILKRKKSLIPKILDQLQEIQQGVHGVKDRVGGLEYKVDIPRGLVNLGCTCYLNASMQQLFRIPEIRRGVFSYVAPEGTNVEGDWLSQLQLLWAKLLYFPRRSIDPGAFTSVWKDWGGNVIDPMEQQDAVEFVQGLLDKIDESIPEKPTTEAVRGTIEHTISGLSCAFTCSNTEDFVVFPLEVSGQSTFEESFEAFQVPDMFIENNQYKSDEYGLIDAKRSHAICKEPKTLIFQLKRFDFDLTTLRRKKLTKEYNISLEVDISPLLAEPPQEPVIYELTGIVQHSGNAQDGHYFSYIKENDQWLNFNDERVTPIKEATVLDNARGGMVAQHVFDDKRQMTSIIKANRMNSAYLLFYRKKGTWIRENPITLMPEAMLKEFSKHYARELLGSVLFSKTYSVFVSFLVSSEGAETAPFMFDQAIKSATGHDGKTQDEIWNCAMKRAESDKVFAEYCLHHHKELIREMKRASPESGKMFTALICSAMRTVPDNSGEFVSHLLRALPKYVKSGAKITPLMVPVLSFVKETEGEHQEILDSLFSFLEECAKNDAKATSNDYMLVFQVILILLTHSKSDLTKYKEVVMNNDFLTRWLASESNTFDIAMIMTFFLNGDRDATDKYFENIEARKGMDIRRLACHFAATLCWRDNLIKHRMDKFLTIVRESEWKTSQRTQFLTCVAEKLPTMPPSNCEEMFQNLQWLHDWLLHTNYSLRQACIKFVYALLRSYPPFKASISGRAQKPSQRVPVSEEDSKSLHLMYDYLIKCSKELISLSRKGASATSSTGRPNPNNVPVGSYFELLAWIGFYGEIDMSANISVFMSILSGISSLKGDMKRPVIDEMHFLAMFGLIDESCVSQLLSYVSKTPSSSSQVAAFREYIDDVSKYLWPLLDPIASKCSRTIVKSRIFEYSIDRCIGDVNSAAAPLSNIISKIANNDNMRKIAKRIWKSQLFSRRMTEKCIAYFTLTIKLLRVGPAAIKEFKKRKCFAAVASHVIYLHENNNQSWTFWELLITILHVVTVAEQSRHAKKIVAFWKVFDNLLTVFHDVLQKPGISKSLFDQIMELFSTITQMMKPQMVKLIENAAPDFICNIPRQYLHEYANFLLSFLPQEPKGQSLLIRQLEQLNSHEIFDEKVFTMLATPIASTCRSQLVSIITVYLNNCRNLEDLGSPFCDLAVTIVGHRREALEAWIDIITAFLTDRPTPPEPIQRFQRQLQDLLRSEIHSESEKIPIEPTSSDTSHFTSSSEDDD